MTDNHRLLRLRAPLPCRNTPMLSLVLPPCPAQPEAELKARIWPRDAQLKRRRSVLFAFTFSPPAPRA